MSGKSNDYGPVVVRGAEGEPVPDVEAWRERAGAHLSAETPRL